MKHLLMIIGSIIVTLLSLLSCSYKQASSAEELLATDKAFSDYSLKNGYAEAFIAFADSDAVILRDNNFPTKGIEEIKFIFENSKDTSITFIWQPIEGFIAKSNDLGYTIGLYTVKSNKTANKIINQGSYVSVWKKNNKNEWKWVVDCGTDGLPESNPETKY